MTDAAAGNDPKSTPSAAPPEAPLVTYEIVEHDEGFAYKVGDVFSETFASHEAALAAAELAAERQKAGGAPELIQYQDEEGRWHRELASGADRPDTEVEDTLENDDE